MGPTQLLPQPTTLIGWTCAHQLYSELAGGGGWRGEEGSLLTLITVLLFGPAVLFLTQRRVQISETLKFNVAKGLTQALRKAFHQNDVSAHVSLLLL